MIDFLNGVGIGIIGTVLVVLGRMLLRFEGARHARGKEDSDGR